MAEKKIRWRLVAIPVLLLVLVGVLFFQFRPGIQVTIQNTGSTATMIHQRQFIAA